MTRAQILEARRDDRARLLAPHVDALQNSGVDAESVLENWRRDQFRYTAVERSLRENNRGERLRETITSTQMANTISLTMVNEIVDDYLAYEPVYPGLAEEHTSNALDELYPEEWSDDLPVQVGEAEPAPESRAAGGQIRIRNYEYARELVIPKRLFDRDKMGQAKRLARDFGKKFEQVKDKMWVYALFRAGVTANMGRNPGQIPNSNLAGQTPGMTTSPGPITPQRLEDALTAPAFFFDPFGQVLTVEMDTVLVDSFDRLKTIRFTESLYTPVGVPVAADATNIGPGPFTNNVLRGMITVKWSRWVRGSRLPLAGAGVGLPWVTLEAGRGPVMQTVHDLEVEMEAANAGDSHNQRAYRWQAVVEFGCGTRNPRLLYFGN